MNRLTQKSQEAVQEAQTVAVRYGHPEADGEHLLLALLDQAEGLVPRLLDQFDVVENDDDSTHGDALSRIRTESEPGGT